MVQFLRMNYSKSLLLYEDDAASGLVLRLVLMIIPLLLCILGLYTWFSNNDIESLELLLEGVVIGIIFWVILPRKYQVYEDYLRIVFGGPFALKIGFDRISSIEVTTNTALTMNLVTKIARNYVRIVKKKGMSIAITPRSNESFTENANRALSQWKKNNNR